MFKEITGVAMDKSEFSYFRNKLSKTQKRLAELLGVSLKAVHSYEQGWRSVPAHVERQILFMVSRMRDNIKANKPCWVRKKCPSELKRSCPAWEFLAGDLCWFVNGTVCGGAVQKNWHDKIRICRSCEVLGSLL